MLSHAKHSASNVDAVAAVIPTTHKNNLKTLLLVGALAIIAAWPSYAVNRVSFDTQIDVESASLDLTRIRFDAAKIPQASAKVASAKLSAIQLISANKGVAIADGKLVLTADAGATWRDITPMRTPTHTPTHIPTVGPSAAT